MSTDAARRFLRVRDVAVALGVSESRAYVLAREGHFPVIHRGRRIYIPAGAFEQWVQARDAEALAAVRG